MSRRPDVLVVGAGVAGLAAAVALSAEGANVTVLERKPYVGGRAYSYEHPALGETIDSQHVLLGCCTNLLDLCRLSGADEKLRWYDSVPFLEPGGRRSDLRAGVGLSASLGFLRAPMLSVSDKLGIARGLMEFVRGYPKEDEESFAAWLRRSGQSERAVRHFWEPIVVATLNDTMDRCTTRYAGQVFSEAFLKSAQGGRMAIPAEPLSDFYARAAKLAEAQGAAFRLRVSVEALQHTASGWRATLTGGETMDAENVVLALPFEQTRKLVALPASELFVHAPITTIHLWFDREVTDIEHCALLDTRIQWMFNKSRIRRSQETGQYLELVISASHAELQQSREQILKPALEELASFFPRVREATLVKSGVLKEARATFSVVPGLDAARPQSARGDGLFLAGDWTQTGWPSTMEGGVRSGRLAAGAILGRNCMTPDLPAQGIMRLFA